MASRPFLTSLGRQMLAEIICPQALFGNRVMTAVDSGTPPRRPKFIRPFSASSCHFSGIDERVAGCFQVPYCKRLRCELQSNPFYPSGAFLKVEALRGNGKVHLVYQRLRRRKGSDNSPLATRFTSTVNKWSQTRYQQRFFELESSWPLHVPQI